METKNLFQAESLRMEAFRLLSDCYRMPEPGLLEKVRQLESNIMELSASAALFVQNMRKEIETRSAVDRLKIDFSKLFVGPYKLFAAPYGSVYLDGERKVMGESTLDVIRRYREAGLETAENFNDVPDHITAELEFMYFLIFREVEALSATDLEKAVEFMGKQKLFLEDHLMAWVPEFAANIKEFAENPFYLNLAKTTETVLSESYQVACSFLDCRRPDQSRSADLNSIRA